jgi:transposase
MCDELGSHLQRKWSCGDDLSSNRRQRPLFSPEKAKEIIETVTATAPVDHQLPGNGWTLKKLRQWVEDHLKRVVSISTLYKVLRAGNLSWKKCKKLLGKRNPEKREAFMTRFLALFEQVRKNEIVLIYVDESHFHRDLETGYTWGPIGKRIWKISDCPPLRDRINWFGAYNFTDGECMIWAEGACNKQTTSEFLQKIADWIKADGRRVVIVWDGAPWHRAKMVKQAGQDLGLEIIQLPGYSPDLNPIEGLWKWMREEVTQLKCYKSLKELFDACKRFIDTINLNPQDVVKRLWPRFELDPELEKLGFPP